jgi:two-component system, sensor histidine kinase ChiS
MRAGILKPGGSVRRPTCCAAGLCALLLILIPGQAAGQAMTQRFQRIGSAQGLSQESALSMAQDSMGYLWVGTQSGLNRYDGLRFVAFRPEPQDSTALRDGWIEKLTVDPQGYVWAGTQRGLSRFDPRTETFRTYVHDPADPSSLANDRVRALLATADGQIWIGTALGLERLDPETGHITRFRHDPASPRSIGAGAVTALYTDRGGRLWIGTESSLIRWDGENDGFIRYDVEPARAGALVSGPILAILERAQGRYLVGSHTSGLYLFDERSGSFHRYAHSSGDPHSLHDNEVWSLSEDAAGDVWVGTRRGLDRFNEKTGRFVHHLANPDDVSALPSSTIVTLLRDRGGVLWIGANEGLARLPPLNLAFTTYTGSKGTTDRLPPGTTWGLAEGPGGRIWIGSDQGLAWLDPAADVATRVPYSGVDDAGRWNSVVSISNVPGDRVWVASRAGLGYIDPQSGAYVAFQWTDAPPNGARAVWTMARDTAGALWLTPARAGLVRMAPDRQSWRSYVHDPDSPRSLSSDVVYVIHSDTTGTLWAGTGDGLNRYDANTDDFVRYHSVPEDTTTLSDGFIASLYRADEHTLWVGTARGLNRLDPTTGHVVRYNRAPGLPSDFVNGILPGDDGVLWLTTNQGILRFDPQSGSVRPYQVQDGLIGNETLVNVAIRASDGRYYIAGSSGVTAFRQEVLDQIDQDAAARSPAVVLTALRVSNELVPVGSALLPHALPYADRLTFTHRQRSFSLEFSALGYGSAERARFAYRLEGFDVDWIHTPTDNRRATYTNLGPGTYTFRVRAIGADGQPGANEAALQIRILPHPLASWWAYGSYALIVFAVILAWERSHRRRLERERAISARLREVDRLKDEFLANVSHELRTPLHGVIGLTEALRDGSAGTLPPKARDDLGMVITGARRLASLVNDILDFSKIRDGEFRLSLGPVDLRALTDVVGGLLRPLADNKGIALRNELAPDLSAVHGDESRIEQILYNLIGNAIKFTDSGSVVIAGSVVGDMVALRVTDTGRGIEADELAKIFEPFHQVEGSAKRQQAGTGLGLALARRLAELQGGSLSVESTRGAGSTFIVMLPRAVGAPVAVAEPLAHTPLAENTTHALLSDPEASRTAPDLPAAVSSPTGKWAAAQEDRQITEVSDEGRDVRVLVVDDDSMNRAVMLNYLAMHGYEVICVDGGSDALDVIENGPPIDIVLLDVMMPNMSGYETCQRLRETHPAHELPVLFLTARNQLSDVVDGFNAGGNDYLTKPVAKAELLSRLRTQSRLLDASRNLDFLVAERTAQVKTLSGLLPICSHCHSIRDTDGYWDRLEAYMRHHSDATFSHGICPPCIEKHYGEFAAGMNELDGAHDDETTRAGA